MTKSYITAIGTANPPHQISQAQTALFMVKHLAQTPQDARKIQLLYRASAIETRYSVLDDFAKNHDFDFYTPSHYPSTATRMEIFRQYACPLAVAAIRDCVRNRDLILNQITHLITVSCTGMYAPGLDIEIIEALALNPGIHRTCINFMGCYAAFNALKTADHICRSEAEAKVLIVGVELCTLHLQQSLAEDDLLANTLFADGAAAVLVESQNSQPVNLQMSAFHCDLAPRGKQDMAWQIGDFGFEMKLSSYIPSLLQTKIQELVNTLLQKINLQMPDIQYFAIHPGGRRILEAIEKSLEIAPEKNQTAYEVLRNYGNMSSVTVLFVLKKILQNLQPAQQGQKILSMAFGPGLTLESALLEIVGVH
ncbi:MAG: type III polyketide synthase [Microscillaceae bacterium]|jgi:predicted naringenin-chalcone synthase|nr:type III polyketide synthase [Microscillaceae bacterium]